MNLNLLRGLGSGILLNLIPEPQVENQVWKVREPDHGQSIKVFKKQTSKQNEVQSTVKNLVSNLCDWCFGGMTLFREVM